MRIDRGDIRAGCFEQLHAAEAMSPQALAQRIGCDAIDVIVALNGDGRMKRVAGDGCWWWALSGPTTRAAKRSHEAAILASGAASQARIAEEKRAAFAVRERIRGAMARHTTGATAKRIAEVAAVSPSQVDEALREMRRRGEVEAFRIQGMAGFEFWRAA